MWASSLVNDLSTPGAALFPILLDAAVKGMAVLSLAGLATLALRRSSASARHLVWFLGACSLLILPVLSATLPGWYVLPRLVPDDPAAVQPPAATATVAPAPVPTIEPSLEWEPRPFVQETQEVAAEPPVAPLASSPLPPVPAPSPLRLPWQAWVVLAWLSGSVLLLVHVILGYVSLWWLRHRSSRVAQGPWPILLERVSAQLGLRRPVELLVSPRRTMPMTWGLWRTRLLLPEESTKWPSDQCRAVLLHELAHAKRWDCLTQLVAQIACALHWFNPLVWVAWRRMQTERERACDDLVLSTGAKASTYAEQLLHIASDMPTVRFSAAAIAMARPSKLEGRLLAILDVTRSRKAVTRLGLLLGTLALLSVALPLAMLRAESREVFPPAQLVGAWKGDAKIIVNWARQQRLPIDIEIAPDGKVTGKVGDAQLTDATVRRNREELGRALNLATDYIITGKLQGPVLKDERVVRDGVNIPFNLANGQIRGGVHTTGSKFGGKDRMILSAASMVLSGPALPATQPARTQSSRETGAEETRLSGELREFKGGVWNKPLIHYARTARPDDWLCFIDLSFPDMEPWVNIKQIGLPADAPGERVAEKAGKGDLYVPEPDVIVSVRGTKVAPLTLKPLTADWHFTMQGSWREATAGMTHEDLARQVTAYDQSHVDKRIHLVEGGRYAALRPDGLLVLMLAFQSPPNTTVQFISVGHVASSFTAPAELDREVSVRVYDVRDIVEKDLRRRGSESRPASDNGPRAGDLETADEQDRTQRVQDLCRLIKESIEAGTWEPEGTVGSLDIWNDRLIVRHTPAVHHRLADMFRQIRGLDDNTGSLEAKLRISVERLRAAHGTPDGKGPSAADRAATSPAAGDVKPQVIRQVFVPDGTRQSNNASWSGLTPSPAPGVLWAHAWAGLGGMFPVQESERTLFEVTVIDGDDDQLVVEVRTQDGAQRVELPRDKTVSVRVGGKDYELGYPSVSVSSTSKPTTSKAMLIVTHRTAAAVPPATGPATTSPPAAPMRTVDITVLNLKTGRPILGATVTTASDGQVTTVQTGPDGRCRVDVSYDAETVGMKLSKPGFLATEYSFGGGYGFRFAPDSLRRWLGKPLTLRLEPAVSVGGLVRDTAGHPLAGAEIMGGGPSPTTRPSDEPAPLQKSPWGKTDAQGRWAFDVPESSIERFSLSIAHPECIRVSLTHDALPPIAALRDKTAVVTLTRAIEITGTLLNEDDQPIPGVEVWSNFFDGKTDEQGRFRAKQVRVLDDPCWVQAPGFLKTQLSEKIVPGMPPLTVRLKRAIQVYGRLVDTAGSPTVGASVSASWAPHQSGTDPGSARYRSGKTDADGSFAIPYLQPGHWQLWVRREGDVADTSIEIFDINILENRSPDPISLVWGKGRRVRDRSN